MEGLEHGNNVESGSSPSPPGSNTSCRTMLSTDTSTQGSSQRVMGQTNPIYSQAGMTGRLTGTRSKVMITQSYLSAQSNVTMPPHMALNNKQYVQPGYPTSQLTVPLKNINITNKWTNVSQVTDSGENQDPRTRHCAQKEDELSKLKMK